MLKTAKCKQFITQIVVDILYSNMTLTFFPLSMQKAAPCENL